MDTCEYSSDPQEGSSRQESINTVNKFSTPDKFGIPGEYSPEKWTQSHTKTEVELSCGPPPPTQYSYLLHTFQIFSH